MRLKSIFILFIFISYSNFNTTYSMESKSSIDLYEIIVNENEGWVVKIISREKKLHEILESKLLEKFGKALVANALMDQLGKVRREKRDLQLLLKNSIKRVGLSSVHLSRLTDNNDNTKAKILERYINLEALMIEEYEKLSKL